MLCRELSGIAVVGGIGIAILPTFSAPAQTVCVTRNVNAFEVPLMLNGAVNVRGTLDSGATDLVLICDSVARALQLNFGVSTDVQTPGGVRRAHTAIMNSVPIGDIALENVETLVLEQKGPCRALVGLSVFNKLRSVTFSRNRAILVGAKGPSRRNKNC
jgi:clan AA aspartic protease (TIGR02281 family)